MGVGGVHVAAPRSGHVTQRSNEIAIRARSSRLHQRNGEDASAAPVPSLGSTELQSRLTAKVLTGPEGFKLATKHGTRAPARSTKAAFGSFFSVDHNIYSILLVTPFKLRTIPTEEKKRKKKRVSLKTNTLCVSPQGPPAQHGAENRKRER